MSERKAAEGKCNRWLEAEMAAFGWSSSEDGEVAQR